MDVRLEGPLDPVLAAALDPVLRDLAVTAGAEARLEPARWGQPFQATAMLHPADGSAAGVGVDRREPAEVRVVQAADGLQEWAVEDRWRRGLPTNWPACPRHPVTHPLQPEVRDGIPSWCCPVALEVVAPIGALAPQ